MQGWINECEKIMSKHNDLKYIYGCYIKIWHDKCDWLEFAQAITVLKRLWVRRVWEIWLCKKRIGKKLVNIFVEMMWNLDNVKFKIKVGVRKRLNLK